MRIVASQISLNAETSVARSTTESAKGQFWVGERPATDKVQVSAAAKATALVASSIALSVPSNTGGAATTKATDAKPSTEVMSDEELLGSAGGARLVILRRLLEAMTGKQIHVARPVDSKPSDADQKVLDDLTHQAQPAAPPTSASSGNQRAGWGIQIDIERTQTETTSVSFVAQGTIVTEDGKTIAFDASFIAQSASITVQNISLREGDAKMEDPLVLLYSGTQAELSQQAQAFDLGADGKPVQLPGISNGAYVVQDLNKNGTVDDGKELIGALSGDGFADLRAMDQDGNGFIDSGDAKYQDLYLWQPGGGKLTGLADAHILGLYTGNAATPFDLKAQNGDVGGRVNTTGIAINEDGTVRPLEQIDVKV